MILKFSIKMYWTCDLKIKQTIYSTLIKIDKCWSTLYLSPGSDSLCSFWFWEQVLFEWRGNGREVLTGRLEKDMVLHLGLCKKLFLGVDLFNVSTSSSPFVPSFRFIKRHDLSESIIMRWPFYYKDREIEGAVYKVCSLIFSERHGLICIHVSYL